MRIAKKIWVFSWAEPRYSGFVTHFEFQGVSGFNGNLVLFRNGNGKEEEEEEEEEEDEKEEKKTVF